MLKQLYSLVTPWAKANRIQKFKNRAVGVLANVMYPLYDNATRPVGVAEKKQNANREQVVISLTSYPARINKIHLCISSILRQEYQPDTVLLYLSKEQFPQGETSLPKKLVELKRHGLEICFVEGDIRSYKKIFYAAKKYMESVLVTADDDVLYPENWLADLVETHEKYSECVVCHRASLMTYDSHGELNLCKNWVSMAPDYAGPDMNLIPIGVGGVLYPARYFANVDFTIENILSMCPTSDDIWLKSIALKKEIPAVKVYRNSKEWFTVKSSQRTSLMSVNTVSRQNGLTENDHAIKNLIESDAKIKENVKKAGGGYTVYKK